MILQLLEGSKAEQFGKTIHQILPTSNELNLNSTFQNPFNVLSKPFYLPQYDFAKGKSHSNFDSLEKFLLEYVPILRDEKQTLYESLSRLKNF